MPFSDLLRAQGLDMPMVSPPESKAEPATGAVTEAAAEAAASTARWARSGLMWLTGREDGPPLAPAGALLARAGDAAGAFDAFGTPAGGEVAREVDVLLGGRAALLGLRRRGTTSANGTCRLVRSADGWVALNLARPDDVDLVGALLAHDLDRPAGTSPLDAAWAAVRAETPAHPGESLVERARLLGLPAAVLTSRPPGPAGPDHRPPGPAGPGHHCVRVHRLGRPAIPARRPLVIDLSSLWAGPLCGHLLGRAGMRVVKVESISRPDGARSGNSVFFDWLHAGHASVAVDFTTRAGRTALAGLVGRADVVIESARPRALGQLGIDTHATVAARPGVTWVSITGYGRDAGGPGEPGPVAFGDDAAVAGGLVAWDDGSRAGMAGEPRPAFCGDAIADPLTGLYAACAARASVAAGGGHLIDVTMAGVAAHAHGVRAHAHAHDADAYGGRAAPPAARRDPREDGWFVDTDAGRVPVAPPRPPHPTGRAAGLGADTRATLAELDGPEPGDHGRAAP